MLKLDMAKAFDSVSWSFLFEILRRWGFGGRWLAKLALLLSSASTCDLINGSAEDPFRHARELRQAHAFHPCDGCHGGCLLHGGDGRPVRAACGVGSAASPVALCGRRCLADQATRDRGGGCAPLVAAIWRSFRSLLQPVKEFHIPYPLRLDRSGPGDADPSMAGSILPNNIPGPPPIADGTNHGGAIASGGQNCRSHIPAWKASLHKRSGHLILINSTLMATTIYHMLALDLPSWFFKCVEKIQRGFFWRGQSDANGGCCLVAWQTVCLSKHYGGLGIHNLQRLNWALRMRWRWLEKTDEGRPWGDLPIALPAEALFAAGLRCNVGDGTKLLFWSDGWMHGGMNVAQIAPGLLSFLARGAR